MFAVALVKGPDVSLETGGSDHISPTRGGGGNDPSPISRAVRVREEHDMTMEGAINGNAGRATASKGQ